MLPKAVPSARILTWGYNADVHAFLGDTSSDRVMQHAHTLIAQLQADREVYLPLVLSDLQINALISDRRSYGEADNFHMPFARRHYCQEGKT